jgi:DNA-directed RNA polymerase subunit RPC12/RpoP
MGPEPKPQTGLEVECPHCHKAFTAEVIEGTAARYRGFKCPHCRLFVPAAHGEDQPLSRDPASRA